MVSHDETFHESADAEEFDDEAGTGLRLRGRFLDLRCHNGRAVLDADAVAHSQPHNYGLHEQYFVGFAAPQSSMQSNLVHAVLRQDLEEGIHGNAIAPVNLRSDSDAFPKETPRNLPAVVAQTGSSDFIWQYKGIPIRPVSEQLSFKLSNRAVGDTGACRQAAAKDSTKGYTRQVGAEKIPLRLPPAPALTSVGCLGAWQSSNESEARLIMVGAAAADTIAPKLLQPASDTVGGGHNLKQAQLPRQAPQLNSKSAKSTEMKPSVVPPGSCPILGRSGAGLVVSEPQHRQIRFKPQYKPRLPQSGTIRVPKATEKGAELEFSTVIQ
jgi:hypothetical protein